MYVYVYIHMYNMCIYIYIYNYGASPCSKAEPKRRRTMRAARN